MTHQNARQQKIMAAVLIPPANTWYVDGAVSVLALQTGSEAFPFKTIQQGIDALIVRDTSILVRAVDRINVAAGDYDEDLTIDLTNRRLHLVGNFNLGVFDQVGWRPVFPPATNPRRNITITGDAIAIDFVQTSLAIYSDARVADPRDSVFIYNTPRISGQIISTMTNSDSFDTSWSLQIQAHVYGTTGDSSGLSIDCTGDQTSPAAVATLQLKESDLEGQINLGANGRLVDADMSIIEGAVTASFVGRVSQCRCKADWTVTETQAFPGTPVNGFINCRFDNDFTWTGFQNFFVDFYSNAEVKKRVLTLVDASKIIIGDTAA